MPQTLAAPPVPPTVAAPPVRLPGISFAVVPPPPPQVLPRMDIAGFVGFAASGPIGVPVAVKDSTQFAAVFGSDVPIAWDPVLGEQAYGLLGPAVRAFFRNGGQRCWVVRVADKGTAQRDRFELPGVAAVDQEGGLGPAVLEASSYGSWADTLSVTSALESAPVHVEQFSPDATSFFATAPAGGVGLSVGDLVRLSFPAENATLYATVGPQSTLTASMSEVKIDRSLWVWPAAPTPGSKITISFLGSDGRAQTVAGTVAADSPPDGGTRVTFDPPLTNAPAPGALVRGTSAVGVVILDVTATEVAADGIGAIEAEALRVGRAPTPSPPAGPDDFAERLTLRLTLRGGAGPPVTLAGLGFAPGAAQFIGALPTDEAFYAPAASPPATPSNSPLATPDPPPDWYVPLGTKLIPSPPLGAMYPATAAVARDGLATFGSQLFLDPALADEPEQTLLETAAWIRDQSPQARPLQGIHALLDNDEVTLLAVPDAVQRGWKAATVGPAPAPAPPETVPEPDWSTFMACSARVLRAPQFPEPDSPPSADPGALVHLSWTATDAPDATYELQQASDPNYGDAADVYLGSETHFDLSPPPSGSNVYLRVRAVAGDLQSAWSEGRLVSVAGNQRWFLNDPSTRYSPQALLEVQVAALRMCAARGDLLAVLAMPEHYRTADAIAHTASLQAAAGRPPGSGQDPMFGFGALYHPWLYCADPTDPSTFRRTSPDGPAAGVAAQRAANRGAWVAPANQPLQDVLALDQPVSDADYLALAAAQINFVRAAPGGFLWLAADTLTQDPAVRPINVRRLLALLRRIAEQYGTAHVFEPNSDLTRRTARRTFQSLLSFLFSTGAFAGASAGEAFQVSTPITADDLDQGRLIVELRVAPSQPLAFLTILLVQSGTGTVQVISR